MGFDFAVNRRQLFGDFLLLTLHEVERDGVIVMRLQQFFPLAFQFVFFPAQPTQLGFIFLPLGFNAPL